MATIKTVMWRDALALGFLVCGVAACQAARPAESKPLIDCDSAELLRAIPELAGTQFDSKQDGLEALLEASGENLRTMLAKLEDISAAEEIHEMRFETNMARISRREDFRYVVKWVPNAAQEQFTEFRLDPATGASAHPPNGEFRGKFGVRANADIPRDAKAARKFGAEGIGLCRTEHMFFAEDRIEFRSE